MEKNAPKGQAQERSRTPERIEHASDVVITDSTLAALPTQSANSLEHVEKEILEAQHKRKRETAIFLKALKLDADALAESNFKPARTRMRTRKEMQVKSQSATSNMDVGCTQSPDEEVNANKNRLLQNVANRGSEIACPKLDTHKSNPNIQELQIRLENSWRKTVARRQRQRLCPLNSNPGSKLADLESTNEISRKLASGVELRKEHEAKNFVGRYKMSNVKAKKIKLRHNVKRKVQIDQILKVNERDSPGYIFRQIISKQARKRNLIKHLVRLILNPEDEAPFVEEGALFSTQLKSFKDNAESLNTETVQDDRLHSAINPISNVGNPEHAINDQKNDDLFKCPPNKITENLLPACSSEKPEKNENGCNFLESVSDSDYDSEIIAEAAPTQDLGQNEEWVGLPSADSSSSSSRRRRPKKSVERKKRLRKEHRKRNEAVKDCVASLISDAVVPEQISNDVVSDAEQVTEPTKRNLKRAKKVNQ